MAVLLLKVFLSEANFTASYDRCQSGGLGSGLVHDGAVCSLVSGPTVSFLQLAGINGNLDGSYGFCKPVGGLQSVDAAVNLVSRCYLNHQGGTRCRVLNVVAVEIGRATSELQSQR